MAKLFKKISVLVVAAVMFFGVFAFAGCDDGYGYVYQEGDFVLTVSARATTLQQGQNIEVTTVFENRSGRRLQIVHGKPMILTVIGEWYQEIRLEVALHSVLRRNQTIRITWQIGSRLPKGEHELMANAEFHFGNFKQVIRIESNIIVLTVV